jgi:FlgD Ig-like domain
VKFQAAAAKCPGILPRVRGTVDRDCRESRVPGGSVIPSGGSGCGCVAAKATAGTTESAAAGLTGIPRRRSGPAPGPWIPRRGGCILVSPLGDERSQKEAAITPRVLLLAGLILAVATVPASGQYPWCFDSDYFTTSASDGVITIHHINAAYNCCPDAFEYTVSQAGYLITVVEEEVATLPCACMCCYDLPLSIGPVAPGEYWIDFVWQDEAHGELHRLLSVVVPGSGKCGDALREVIVIEPTDCTHEPPADIEEDSAGGDRPGSGATLTPILHPGRPNPARGPVAIDYELPARGGIRLEIYGAGGARIRTLVEAIVPAGTHTVTWDRTDDEGKTVASGVYFCRITGSAGAGQQRLILLN